MKIHLYLLTPSLVELLIRPNRSPNLAGQLFDAIYGAYKPQKVANQNDHGVESKLVEIIGVPVPDEAKGLREIALELHRLRQRAAQGAALGDVGALIKGFIKQYPYRQLAIEYLEKRFLPKASKRLRGKPVIFYPTAAELSNPNFRDSFDVLLREVKAKEARVKSSAPPVDTGVYAPMPPAQQSSVSSSAPPPNSIYGAGPPAALPDDYGLAPPPTGPGDYGAVPVGQGVYGAGPAEIEPNYGPIGSAYFVTDGDDNYNGDANDVTDDNDAATASTAMPRDKKRSDDNDSE